MDYNLKSSHFYLQHWLSVPLYLLPREVLTTSATVGIASLGVGGALGFDLGMVAGAVISGVILVTNYSMSDTTNPVLRWLN
jgi:Na+/H+ antiporter NhaC